MNKSNRNCFFLMLSFSRFNNINCTTIVTLLSKCISEACRKYVALECRKYANNNSKVQAQKLRHRFTLNEKNMNLIPG